MPEHIRALIVVLLIAVMVFAFARRSAGDIIGPAPFARRRNLWFVLTLVAFLSQSIWIYAGIAGLLLLAANQAEQNRFALFFTILFVLPPAAAEIPGFGLVNFLFELNHLRLLSLAVLLPAFFALRGREGTTAFGRLWPDRLLATYLVLLVFLQLRETTTTDTLRQLFYVFLDVFLPYYVASRAIRDLADFRDALLAFFLAASIIAVIGMFEAARHWLLYSAVASSLGLRRTALQYLDRAGILRARATAGHPIALGYVVAVALGLFLYLKDLVQSRLHRGLAGLMLVGGLIAPFSRGPWVGVVALLVTFLATGQRAAPKLAMLVVAAVAAIPLLAVIPGGQKALDFLPFIGSIEKENIDYRQQLLTTALVVIERNPWLGSATYLQAPEMEAMRQGQGIIDIVNTYIGVTLEAGLIGLSLFIGFFLTVLSGLRKALRSVAEGDEEARRLGRALLATLIGILVTIFTVSSIGVIPIIYWSVAGLGVAYAQMLRKPLAEVAVARS